MTTLVMLAILLTGIGGYFLLPVSDLPNVDFPTLLVSASLPGASPETIAGTVATPLERQFTTIAGLDSMSSVSSLGQTRITLQFDLGRDIDAAALDVQSAISRVIRSLPEDMPTPPSYRKVNPADQPILYLALSSSALPLSEVDEFADTFIAQRISMVNGVAQVSVYGSQKYAVRIRVNPESLASKEIGIDEVAEAIREANVNMPTGDLQGAHHAYTVESEGQLARAVLYEDVVVTWRDNSPVRISDLGEAADSVEDDRAAGWFNNERAIVLAIQRQPGTNTVEVVDNIRELLPTFEAQMPAAMKLNILSDRSRSIRESVHEVKFTLALTISLVILVIFLFLRNITATVIPSLALILSVVGSFAVMHLLGYSLNNLTLMALTLSVGFVVDDAIVMIENIVRHMEHGETPLEASFKGSREIGFTIVSMTLSLAAVFIPVLFMGGLMGRLLREFSVTIAMAILISGFVSLTQTPTLCSRFLRPAGNRHGILYNALERLFDGMLRAYEASLAWALRWRLLTFSILIPLVVLTGYLFVTMPKGFLPSEDIGQISAVTEAAQGISFEEMVRNQRGAAAIVEAEPGVQGFMSSVGTGGSTSTSNAGRMLIQLKPREERPGVEEIIQSLRRKTADLPGIRVFFQNPPSIRIGGQFTKSQYQFTLQSPDTENLYRHAPVLEERLRGIEGFQDVTSDLQISNPEARIQIDRDKAASLGVSVERIETALFSAYGSRQVSTIYGPNNEYQVILELAPEFQLDPTVLSRLYIRSRDGDLIPLETIATVRKSVGPLTVTHLGQLPAVTLSFSLAPGISLGTAVAKVNEAAREVLPAGINTSFQGTAQAFESSSRGLGYLLLAAILVIYIVLGILYESFIHPITILSGLPSAGVGALVTLLIFGMDLNVYSFVGIIMLVGIVKKNAIMMIDFAIEAQRASHLEPAEAIFRACVIRFRPIMMTTLAALMGTLPIALALGAGSEARRPLGLAVVGGLLVSQFLTLYITPVFYIYMEALRSFLRSHTPARQIEQEAVRMA
ncbi:MAG: Multidrug resistance protein MdtB [bacterium]|nr:Multidrug resistance protein MdtB [bacterium]